MLQIEPVVEFVTVVFEMIGVAVMIIGFTIAAVLAVRALARGRGGAAAFKLLRTIIGSSILLGLEVLVAADLIKTVTTPTLEEALILGIIVMIRTVLSVSIQIEIEGVLPWKRALFTSGGRVLGDTLAKETRDRPVSG
ncbi:DUF1622 domain-containing protein [Gulosibacter sp. 10]|uniref:DUF1622 domain-containing protein n=1 Tax=Gulosibacter sp. 10 TaxID=1255570 RepID=UPI00097F56EE|nr:DUF1622 domain-containing protein [Gulosibacter sp. 10]SJM62181.1 protein of unknown function DUF1622 [Gulosibacter sp. 10]